MLNNSEMRIKGVIKIMIKYVYLNRIIDLKSIIEKEGSFNEGLITGAKNQK